MTGEWTARVWHWTTRPQARSVHRLKAGLTGLNPRVVQDAALKLEFMRNAAKFFQEDKERGFEAKVTPGPSQDKTRSDVFC